jgi:hypothetical protein
LTIRNTQFGFEHLSTLRSYAFQVEYVVGKHETKLE